MNLDDYVLAELSEVATDKAWEIFQREVADDMSLKEILALIYIAGLKDGGLSMYRTLKEPD